MNGYIGIDPGVKGAAAIILEDGRYILYDYDNESQVSLTLCRWKNEFNVTAAIEKITTANKPGHFASAKLSQNYGFWRGVLTALDIRFIAVMPRTWQAAMLMAASGKDTKERSLSTAKFLYPGTAKSLRSKSKHNGRSDALLIAGYLKGQQQIKLSNQRRTDQRTG